VTAIHSIPFAGHMLVFNPAAVPASSRTTDEGPSAAGSSFESVVVGHAARKTIDAARRGDRAALASLLRDLQDPWYRLCLGMLRDPDAAADAVQETGLRFIRQVAGFRGDSQLRTWSLGIAINVVREMKRRRARHLTGTAADDADPAEPVCDIRPTPTATAELGEARDALRQTLDDLPDRQREAVVLRFFEDLSVERRPR
jgi:RNA polymerase sigma-70 factor (ECF subfamily)